jgi:hypothetical protein
LSWSILALWKQEEIEANRKFEARFAVTFPAQEDIDVDIAMPIDFAEGKPNFRNVLKITGLPLMPLLKTESCEVRVFLRERETNNPWEQKGQFPIIVRHKKK